MGILDHLTPAYYRVDGLRIEQREEGYEAIYEVAILNAQGHRIAGVRPGSALTPEELAALGTMFTRDKAQFEAATSLTEWQND